MSEPLEGYFDVADAGLGNLRAELGTSNQADDGNGYRVVSDHEPPTSNANVLAIHLDIAERALLDVAELLVSVDGCAYCPVWDSINVGCRPPNDDRSCAARIAEQAKEKVAREDADNLASAIGAASHLYNPACRCDSCQRIEKVAKESDER